MILGLVQHLSVRLKATISDIAVDHSLLVQLVLFVCKLYSFYGATHCMLL